MNDRRDTTVKKIDSSRSPKSPDGCRYLVSGVNSAMRVWEEQPDDRGDSSPPRDYETLGYVLHGMAILETEGQTVRLEPGDSWVVPSDAEHSYRILEPFKAVEVTCPPARLHGRQGLDRNEDR